VPSRKHTASGASAGFDERESGRARSSERLQGAQTEPRRQVEVEEIKRGTATQRRPKRRQRPVRLLVRQRALASRVRKEEDHPQAHCGGVRAMKVARWREEWTVHQRSRSTDRSSPRNGQQSLHAATIVARRDDVPRCRGCGVPNSESRRLRSSPRLPVAANDDEIRRFLSALVTRTSTCRVLRDGHHTGCGPRDRPLEWSDVDFERTASRLQRKLRRPTKSDRCPLCPILDPLHPFFAPGGSGQRRPHGRSRYDAEASKIVKFEVGHAVRARRAAFECRTCDSGALCASHAASSSLVRHHAVVRGRANDSRSPTTTRPGSRRSRGKGRNEPPPIRGPTRKDPRNPGARERGRWRCGSTTRCARTTTALRRAPVHPLSLDAPLAWVNGRPTIAGPRPPAEGNAAVRDPPLRPHRTASRSCQPPSPRPRLAQSNRQRSPARISAAMRAARLSRAAGRCRCGAIARRVFVECNAVLEIVCAECNASARGGGARAARRGRERRCTDAEHYASRLQSAAGATAMSPARNKETATGQRQGEANAKVTVVSFKGRKGEAHTHREAQPAPSRGRPKIYVSARSGAKRRRRGRRARVG